MIEHESDRGGGAVPGFRVGDFVDIRCEIQPGPFSGEYLVTIDTIDGAISGFVRDTELKVAGDEWRVRGRIRHVDSDVLEVWIKGSFLTTNGIANVSSYRAIAA